MVDQQTLIRQAQKQIGQLQGECPHFFLPLTDEEKADDWMSVGAYCDACGTDFGWRCKISPDGVCHYFTEDGMVELIDGQKVPPPADHDTGHESDDWCVFCGMPDERK